MRQAAYAAIAHAVNERRMESRNQTYRKVVQLAGDLAAILAHEDAHFDSADFYRACGLRGEDIATINDGTRAVDFEALSRRVATDRGDDETHQGYTNYETFTICVWLDNDRRLRDDSVFLAKSVSIGAEFPDVRAADALREWIESKHLTENRAADVEDVLSGVANTLLNSALGDVDWLQVAHTRLDMAGVRY